MFRRGISNILLILILFLIVSCINRSGYQFSRKYSPIYNPDGEAFDSNVEFSRAYSIYKERRDALVSGIGNKNAVKYETKRKVQVENVDQLLEKILSEKEDDDLMIDGNGINLVDIAGAKFIDLDSDDVVDDDIHSNSVTDKHIKVGSSSESKIIKAESNDKSSNTKDKKPEVTSTKIPIITKDEDKTSNVKDKEPEVISSKIPIITKDENKTSDVKDKEPEVISSKIPIITKDENKTSDVKGKKPKVASTKIPIITKNENKTSDVKDKEPEVISTKIPIITKDENKTSDVKDKKPEVTNNKIPITKGNEDKNNDNQSDNEELVTKDRDNGLRSLLKFSKDDDKQKNDDDVNSHVLLKPESDIKQLPEHDSEENSKQKHTHKAVHFLSFLKEPEDVEEDIQEVKRGANQNNESLNMERDVKVINEHNPIAIDHNDQNEQVKISQEENNIPMRIVEQVENMTNNDEEDYTLAYYYEYENVASY